jgi:hypothetical protein
MAVGETADFATEEFGRHGCHTRLHAAARAFSESRKHKSADDNGENAEQERRARRGKRGEHGWKDHFEGEKIRGNEQPEGGRQPGGARKQDRDNYNAAGEKAGEHGGGLRAPAEQQAQKDADPERRSSRGYRPGFDPAGQFIRTPAHLAPGALAGRTRRLCGFGARGTSGRLDELAQPNEFGTQLLELVR